MTDRTRFEQMLEHLINGEQSQAEEVFHELVVAKSREIYENLLDDDFQVDEASEEDEEKKQQESDDDTNENFDFEAIGGDKADSMIDAVTGDDDDMDMDMDMDHDADSMGMASDMGDEGGDDPATKDDVMDIKDALDDLRAEFENMLNGDNADMDMDDEEDDELDDEEKPKEEYVREYVEKVAPAKMGDNGVNNKSIVAKPNNMGGTTANLRGGESTKGGTQGGLANPSTKDLNTGNVNTPGSKTATKMHPTQGHGAERKGSGDNGVNTKSTVGK